MCRICTPFLGEVFNGEVFGEVFVVGVVDSGCVSFVSFSPSPPVMVVAVIDAVEDKHASLEVVQVGALDGVGA